MSKPMKKMLVTVGIVFALIFGWYGAKKILFMIFIATYSPPPVTISATVAANKVWQPYLTSIGTLTAVNGAEISAEASGIVNDVHFTSGQLVKQGDLLVQLDTGIEEAELKDNLAKLKLAQINQDRNNMLAKKNVISPSAMDASIAQLQEAEANVEATRAKIKQKTIVAPFAGKLGIQLVNKGEYVGAGTAMVTLQSLDPLYVRFNLPAQYLPEIYLNQAVDISVNFNSSGTQYIRGTITAINSKVDQSTRNVLIQATLPNKNLQLYPGMFALIKVWLHQQNNVITIPQSAIDYSLHGDSVFQIKTEGKGRKAVLKAYREYVKVGERRDDEVAIISGIHSGDEVATSGQLKLSNGTHVLIDNSLEH